MQSYITAALLAHDMCYETNRGLPRFEGEGDTPIFETGAREYRLAYISGFTVVAKFVTVANMSLCCLAVLHYANEN